MLRSKTLVFRKTISNFSDELSRLGPQSVFSDCSLSEGFAYCKGLTKRHYENFNVASFFLPQTLKNPFYAVYAYCRWSDDLGDEHDGSEAAKQRSLQLFDWWEGLLNDCFQYAQPVPKHPVFVALRGVAQEFHLQKKYFTDLLVAFRRDQIQSHYKTFNDLLDYCNYSANPVGRIILHLMMQRNPDEVSAKLSDFICTGLQLANHWQDIERDRKIGRCYIPQEIAERFHVDWDNLSENGNFREMLRFLTDDARQRLETGHPLIYVVPKCYRNDIKLFIEGGMAILDATRRCGYNVLSSRPTVSRWTKIKLLLKALYSR